MEDIDVQINDVLAKIQKKLAEDEKEIYVTETTKRAREQNRQTPNE